MALESNQSITPEGWRGSTYRNSSIKTYNDVKNRVLAKLGVGADKYISDYSITQIIDSTLERYSRYAGYTQEYVVFCDDALDDGCSVQLNDLVNKCLVETENSWEEYTYVVSSEVIDNFVGSGVGLLNSYYSLSSNGETALNLIDSIEETNVELLFDPSNPWDFEVCDSNKVCLSSNNNTPLEILSPILSATITVSGGEGEFYPPNFEDLDNCGPLSSWWGIDENQLSSFDPESATHINITGIPNCTVEGINPLTFNNGKGGKFRTSDLKLDTCGELPAYIQFVKDYSLPESLSGCFCVDKNSGFKLKLDDSTIDEFVTTPEYLNVLVDFYETVSSVEYGVSALPYDVFKDEDFGEQRKVASVFDVSSEGGSGATGGLFSFQHQIVNSTFGYDGRGNRFNTNGYDLVSYELALQYIEQANQLFGTGDKVGFNFNPNTQRLRVNRPAAGTFGCYGDGGRCYLLGLHVEKPIAHMIGETWVLDFVEAQMKITIGNTLNQYQGAQTIGGITVNGTDILSQGLAEEEALLAWLRESPSEGGSYPAFMLY